MTLPPKRGVGGCSYCCFGGGSTDSGGCSCHWIRRVTQKALGITHLDPTPAVSPNRVRCLRFLAVPGGKGPAGGSFGVGGRGFKGETGRRDGKGL